MNIKRYIDSMIRSSIRRAIRGKMRMDGIEDELKKNILDAQTVIGAVIHNPMFNKFQHDTKRVFGRLMTVCTDMLNTIYKSQAGSLGSAEPVSSKYQPFSAARKNNTIWMEGDLGTRLANYANKAISILNINKFLFAIDRIEQYWDTLSKLFKIIHSQSLSI